MIKHPEIRRNVSLRIFSKQTESQRQKFLFDLLSDMITDSYFPFLSKRKMTEEQRIEIEKKINSCVKPNIELWFKDYITGDDKEYTWDADKRYWASNQTTKLRSI